MRWNKVPSTQYSVTSSRRKVGRWALGTGHWILDTGYWVLLACVTLLSATPAAAASALPSADDKHISVYSPGASYTLPVLDRAGHEYVGLLELLEPLGRVSSQSGGQRWKLRFNAVEAEFSVGKTRAKVHGRNFDFAAPFLMENARGLVPLSSLGTLLPRFLGTAINSFSRIASIGSPAAIVPKSGILIIGSLDATIMARALFSVFSK